MEYGWDSAKAATNVAKHGVAFAAAKGFEWDTATIELDDRADYGEDRFIARGFIGVRLHVLVFTPRPPLTWIISLRRANKAEVKGYAEG